MFFTPRWIASHVFVAALVASFIVAGLWQVDRLGQRRDTNALVEARFDDAPASLDALASLPPDDLEFRPVIVEGSYLPAEIYVGNRSENGSPGSWAWTGFSVDERDRPHRESGFRGPTDSSRDRGCCAARRDRPTAWNR